MAGRNHPERNAAEGRAGAAKERQGAVGQRGAGTSESRDEKDRRASEKERIRRTDCSGQGVFKGLIMPRKSSRKNIRFPLKKVQKQREVYQKTVSEFSGRAGRAPGAGTERGLPVPGMWFFRASASGNTSQRTGCGSGNPGQRETKAGQTGE